MAYAISMVLYIYIVYRSTGISNQPVVADLNWIEFMKKPALNEYLFKEI